MLRTEKSLKLNMLLNAIKNLMAVVFPLITFSYVSKTLGVESLGQYNFAVSVISYITLLAGLGIETYAIREGAKYRDDKEKFSKFASQIFSINIVTTLFSYLVLAVLLISVSKFHDYTTLLLVLATQVIFTTLGVNWIFSIYEEFAYITIRSILFQVLAIIAIFIFVKTPEDLVLYCGINAGVIIFSNVINFFVAFKYCKLKITFNLSLKTHLKPILILFVTIASITLYTSSGTVILGFISGDYAVGIYTVSYKIYAIIKQVLFSAIVVSIPRMAMLLGNQKKEEANQVSSEILATTISIVVPAVVGCIVLANEIIVLISDVSYVSAVAPHIILTVAILFSMGGYFWGHAVLIPAKEENFYLVVTIVSAVVNVGLNLVLIPFLDVEAAAIATLLAEIVAFLMCYFKGRKHVKTSGTIKTIIKSSIASLIIIPIVLVSKYLLSNMVLYVVVSIAVSVISYFTLSILLKNNAVISLFTAVINRFKKKPKENN